jgi:UDP-N-acetylglucosamine 2-epimerase (non-hydrolysing)
MPFRVALIVGTRPEAIKMAPLMLAARGHAALNLELIATGQQDALFDEAIAAFGLSPDHHLGAVAGASLDELRAALTIWMRAAKPDLVLVQGDTNTALAGAQAAAALGIALGHVEAGLRTHNPERPFPEENNRVAIGQLATLHFAPAQRAADNLAAEGVRGEVHITGNPGIDALMLQAAQLPKLNQAPPQHILITCHRRENFGAPLLGICAAIRDIAAASPQPLILPVHPNPNVGNVIRTELGGVANLALITPLSYPEMIAAIRTSAFVLSDSGGVQEECAALGVPLLLMREETERQELVERGNVRLVGGDTALIRAEANRLLRDPTHRATMAQPVFPYGSGDAAEKIITLIEKFASRAMN